MRESENINTYVNQILADLRPLAEKLDKQPHRGNTHSPEANIAGKYFNNNSSQWNQPALSSGYKALCTALNRKEHFNLNVKLTGELTTQNSIKAKKEAIYLNTIIEETIRQSH